MQRIFFINEVLEISSEMKDEEIANILEELIDIKFVNIEGRLGLSYKAIKEYIRTFPLVAIKKEGIYKDLIFQARPKERIRVYNTTRSPEYHYTPRHVLLQLLYMRERNVYETELKNEIIGKIYNYNRTNMRKASNKFTELLLK